MSVQVQPDPKPRKRIVDVAVTRMVRHRNTGCVVCGERLVSVHHLVPRSLGGDDVPENLVLLCGDGTSGCHGAIESRSRTICVRLRAALTDEQLAYVVGKKGLGFLSRYYPVGIAP